MPDVVVNILGNSEPLKRELDSISKTETEIPISSRLAEEKSNIRTVQSQPDDRLVDSIRQTIINQGASYATQSDLRAILDVNANAQKSRIESDITNKYNAKRDALTNKMSEDYENIDSTILLKKQERIKTLGSSYTNDPLRKQLIDKEFDDFRENEYKRVGTKYDEDLKLLDNQEAEEKKTANDELTDAIKELTEEFKRQSDSVPNPESYINSLKRQRNQFLSERDSATDEEGAKAAQKKADEIDKKLKGIMGGDSEEERSGRGLAGGISGGVNLLTSAASGNVSGMAAGAAGALGIASAGLIATAVLAAIVGGIKLAQMAAETSDSLGELSGFRAPSEGLYGKDARIWLGSVIPRRQYNGVDYTDLGMDVQQFGQSAVSRVRASGSSEDLFRETISSLSLQKVLGLKEGSLIQGSQFDRYGQTVNEAVSKLVTVLGSIEGSGVTFKDFSRVQEKFDIQQQVMSSYMNRTDKPNYDIAGQMVAGFSSVKGITQDSRIGSDIAQFQNMIQNPMNDRMRALIFSTVSDLFPETGGRTDKIDRIIKDPAHEAEIIQAVVKRITAQYGGTDTQMGYWAFQSLLGQIAPDRIDAYTKAFANGDAEGFNMDFSSNAVAAPSAINRTGWEVEVKGLLTDLTRFTKEIKDGVVGAAGVATGTRTNNPNKLHKE